LRATYRPWLQRRQINYDAVITVTACTSLVW
jgi:hypothetical protein